MDGLLLVDKPSGWTSFDVVAKVRGMLKQTGIAKPKVGHTGTLDPLATGLLVLVVGKYTKRAQEFFKLDKTYQVTMELGQTSTTGDEEGEKTKISDNRPTQKDLEEVIKQFTGQIDQVPPAFSAIKIGGQRAYKLARAGQKVELEPRKVEIYGINLEKYDYPAIQFTAKVSSGTYIRSLVADIGEKLGTGAYMTGLSRTQVGQFELEKAVDLSKIMWDNITQQIIVTDDKSTI